MNRAPSAARRALKVFCAVATASAVIFAAGAAARPVAAQAVWTERNVIVKELSNRYREAPAALGVTSEGSVPSSF
jgi:hypothetical protein